MTEAENSIFVDLIRKSKRYDKRVEISVRNKTKKLAEQE